MRIKFSKAAERLGVSAGGVFASGTGACVCGASAAFFASCCASRCCSATNSSRSSPSVVNGRRSITRNDSSGFFSATVLTLNKSVCCKFTTAWREGVFAPSTLVYLKICSPRRKVLGLHTRKHSHRPMPPTKKRIRKSKKRAVARKTAAGSRRESAGEWFERLVKVQARLRGPYGCPWDVEQTHLTLRTYLIEEAYEVLEALDSGDDAKFAEELGDLLLQVVFHAQIATEERRFTAADVVREIHQKMVRRHPHVFGEKRAKDATEVLKNWEQIKAEERRAQNSQQGTGQSEKSEPAAASLLDGIPHTLPAVMQGYQLTRRRAGRTIAGTDRRRTGRRAFCCRQSGTLFED